MKYEPTAGLVNGQNLGQTDNLGDHFLDLADLSEPPSLLTQSPTLLLLSHK